MNHLIVFAHPNPNSFCAAILKTATEASKAKGNQVKVRNLYELGFNPSLSGSDFAEFQKGSVLSDIKIEQNEINWAENITYIYPIWWTGLPAILKGYFDRVFSYGFAYSVGANGIEKLLTSKKVILISTQGQPKDYYDKLGMFDALQKTSDMGIFDFVGSKVLEHKFFAAVPYVDDATRKNYLEEVKTMINKFV